MTAKGKAKLERAEAIQKIMLKFMRKHGSWQPLNFGPEVMKYEDSAFLMIFQVKDPVPLEFELLPTGVRVTHAQGYAAFFMTSSIHNFR